MSAPKKQLMQALVFDGPERLTVRHREIPRPGPDEVLLRVAATGICGSDLHGYMGKTGRRQPGMIMGHEIVAFAVDTPELEGRPVAVNPVIACGECRFCTAGFDNLCSSRRLIGVDADIIGGFAEYMVAPKRNLVPLPPGVRVELGALVEPFAVGYRTALEGGVQEGASVLIIGAGAIGIACLVAARRLGAACILVSEPNEHRRATAARLGAITVDPTSKDLVDRVLSETNAEGARCVLDCVGLSSTIEAGLEACAPRGTVTLVGMESPRIEFPTYALITQERRLLGNFGYTARHFREVAEWIGSDPPELSDYIAARVGLDEASERFHALATGQDPSLKIVVNPER
jgi:2-desacetyl-2-hydroxyethyl bacteriochlorophyllide A dehydrogenase